MNKALATSKALAEVKQVAGSRRSPPTRPISRRSDKRARAAADGKSGAD